MRTGTFILSKDIVESIIKVKKKKIISKADEVANSLNDILSSITKNLEILVYNVGDTFPLTYSNHTTLHITGYNEG